MVAFTDQEYDNETALHYMDARYYDADLKRFTSVDAWGGELTNPQTFNKYSYVGNNPLKYTDPSGNYWETALDGIFFGISLNDYNNNPSWTNGFFVAADGIGLAAPVPAVFGYAKNGTRAYKTYNYFGEVASQAGTSALSITGTYINTIVSGFKQSGAQWSQGKAGDSLASLVGHFRKHQDNLSQFGVKSVDDYYARANSATKGDNGFVALQNKDGSSDFFNPGTNELVGTNKSGDISTYQLVDNE